MRRIVAAALLLVTAPAAAQDPTGTIEGTVTDSSSAIVSGARVSARHLDTGFTRDIGHFGVEVAIVCEDADRGTQNCFALIGDVCSDSS